MNQLFSAFGLDWRLLLAQAVNFGVVLLALRYFLYKPVMQMLEKRRVLVAKGVEDAARAAEKLAGADEVATKRVLKAELEAEEIVKAAHTAASQNRSKMLAEAEERSAQIARDADMRATELAERIRRESEKDIARLAVLAAGKLMQERHAKEA